MSRVFKGGGGAGFRQQLDKVYSRYTLGFFAFVLLLGALEHAGMPREMVGLVFLLATVGLYAGIGIMSRTTDPVEYYVAGRRVPAFYNGMAIGADWMSAASFIGLAGTLYLTGYSGLAFIMGWTGGYCLVALLLAPYLRKFGQFTIPDFLAERYGGRWPRILGVAAALVCSFTYVVAQIYGVGLITSRLTGVAFELGIFLGLGGILVCSFLGGMRAVTWTQVAQYIILIVAYLIPVVWLSVKQTGVPVPQAVYGYQLEKVTAKEVELMADPSEQQVRALYAARANDLRRRLQDTESALRADKQAAEAEIERLQARQASQATLAQAEQNLAALPRDPVSAAKKWREALSAAESKARPLNGMPPHAAQFAGDPAGTPEDKQRFDDSRANFLALMFCLMVGTAALPHVLIRYYTVPGVKEARHSVSWALFFIFLLYITAPALAVLVKYEIFHSLIGTSFDQLPQWVSAWNKVDPGLLSVADVNHDGKLQLNELTIGGDIIVLATAEIAGLPYIISALVAAGGLAAALSTADGLLLTIASSLSHDLYYKLFDPGASTARRVTISKVILLVVALLAAYVAAQKPADILFLVSAAFSFAASAFFPALVLGIFWKRANGPAAALGMMSGLGVTFYYMATTQPWLRSVFGIHGPIDLWWGIQPISAGVFGVPVGFAVIILVSWLTPAPTVATQRMVEHLRYPRERLPEVDEATSR